MREHACRAEGSTSLLPLRRNGQAHTRQQLYCPDCQFTYRVKPCPFRPHPAFKPEVVTLARGASGSSNIFGNNGRFTYTRESILELLVALYQEIGPFSTKDIQERGVESGFPGTNTIKRCLGGITQAREAVREVLGIEADVWVCQWCQTEFPSLWHLSRHELECEERG